MIKSSELRVGNLVAKGADWFTADFITIQMAHNYDPIPLTPEILEKAGFKNAFDNCYTFNGNSFAIFYHKEACYHTSNFKHRSNFVDIKYLHQLQNLYFALTGQELQIKELV